MWKMSMTSVPSSLRLLSMLAINSAGVVRSVEVSIALPGRLTRPFVETTTFSRRPLRAVPTISSVP